MDGQEVRTERRARRPLLGVALLAGTAVVAVTIAYPTAARHGKANTNSHAADASVAAPHLAGESARGNTPRLVFSTRTVVYAGAGSRVGRTQALASADETPKFEGYITYPR